MLTYFALTPKSLSHVYMHGIYIGLQLVDLRERVHNLTS